VDGSPEAVADGVTGFLVQPGDVAGAADKVIRLLRDPALRRKMGEEGRRRVAEFDIDLMVRRQEELYEQLLAERGSHSRK
jgi:glycosyltransferase involved in cell wall biosynthesis